MLTITAFRTKMWLRRGANQFTNCINHCTTLSTMFIILFRFLTSHVTKVECFSDSIPLSDCSPMKSIHGVQPQQGPHPFVTYADKSKIINNGDVVKLTLTIKQRAFGSDVSFKGYLVMAFDSESNLTDVSIGSFLLPSDGQVVSCPDGQSLNNAVTHQSSDKKQFVTVNWTPPKDYVGLVSFRTTYLTNGTVFWINTQAAYLVRVIDPIAITLPPSTETLPLTTLSSTDTSYSDMATSEGYESIATTTEEMMFNVTEDGYNSTNSFTTDETTTHVTTGMTSTTKPSGSGPTSEFRLDFNVLLASLACWAGLRLRDKHLLLIVV
ncbi:hypothetical protein OUZ56_014160 [Daphnia magna]|uniref:Reelin domain-containing protein n=1 Tax=Daphnia magna TaxID=35525 RepID=A0ABQ9Z802_9CRUS|nr:hypothetical protein OUZ56_014160 [Daphnia magna]